MNILVTAGNTQVPIDQVRCLTNIFSGRTGAGIAATACAREHTVTLLTSHPEVIAGHEPQRALAEGRWRLLRYRTYDDLDGLMAHELQRERHDALIHCAAVSDFQAAGIYAAAAGTQFASAACTWTGNPPALVDRAAAKVKSDEPELWLRLVRAPKLVDKVRRQWAFGGIVVKFKLEVGISEERLLDIAEKSRLQSNADLMVANTFEERHHWAYLGPRGGRYQRLQRHELPERLLEVVESLHLERHHG
jgi:phosphopantothenoylcysteine synthetase/decarboxylase